MRKCIHKCYMKLTLKGYIQDVHVGAIIICFLFWFVSTALVYWCTYSAWIHKYQHYNCVVGLVQCKLPTNQYLLVLHSFSCFTVMMSYFFTVNNFIFDILISWEWHWSFECGSCYQRSRASMFLVGLTLEAHIWTSECSPWLLHIELYRGPAKMEITWFDVVGVGSVTA